MKVYQFVFLLLCLSLVSCTTLGPGFKETMKLAPQISPDKTRLYFFRTSESGLYSARDAAINIDGTIDRSCPTGSFFYIDIKQGKHVIKTDMWDLPGSCVLTLNGEAGKSYYFEVTARMESFTRFITTGFVGNIVESSEKDCSGAFAIVPTEEQEAIAKLSKLKVVK